MTSKEVVLTRDEYEELYALPEQFSAILESPSKYRTYYREELEKGELFEFFKAEIVRYAKEEPSFERYLLSALGGGEDVSRSATSVRSGTMLRPYSKSSSTSLQSLSIFSPRVSSRPIIRS